MKKYWTRLSLSLARGEIVLRWSTVQISFEVPIISNTIPFFFKSFKLDFHARYHHPIF